MSFFVANLRTRSKVTEVSLSNPTGESVTFTPSVLGDYKFSLVVSNLTQDSVPDYVYVTVSNQHIDKNSRGYTFLSYLGGEVGVEIPPETFSVDAAVSITIDPTANPREIDPLIITNANNKCTAAGFNRMIPGSTIEFNAYDVSTSNIISTFNNNVTIKIPYSDSDDDGMVDDLDTSIGEEYLRIFHLNETNRPN